MRSKSRSWAKIDSPSSVALGHAAKRPWWHLVLDDLLLGIENGFLILGSALPWILLAGFCVWRLSR